MIRILNKKFPSDIDLKVIGFSLPINGTAVFNPVYNTKEQIKYNLINYLLTNWGERVFNYNFGANLRALLFEGIEFNKLQDLETSIQSNISKYFPKVKINELKLTPFPDENKVVFSFNYTIPEYGVEDQIEINIQ